MGYPRLIISALAALTFACQAKVQGQGFPIHSDIDPGPQLFVGLDQNKTDPNLRTLLPMAVRIWNQQMGRRALRISTSTTKPGIVIIQAQQVHRLSTTPAHTKLLGCMKRMGSLGIPCFINIEVPMASQRNSIANMTKLAHLFKPGSFDTALSLPNDSPGRFLTKKHILVSLVHELGHAIGLAHTKDPNCIMHATPEGSLDLCPAEIEAARSQFLID